MQSRRQRKHQQRAAIGGSILLASSHVGYKCPLPGGEPGQAEEGGPRAGRGVATLNQQGAHAHRKPEVDAQLRVCNEPPVHQMTPCRLAGSSYSSADRLPRRGPAGASMPALMMQLFPRGPGSPSRAPRRCGCSLFSDRPRRLSRGPSTASLQAQNPPRAASDGRLSARLAVTCSRTAGASGLRWPTQRSRFQAARELLAGRVAGGGQVDLPAGCPAGPLRLGFRWPACTTSSARRQRPGCGSRLSCSCRRPRPQLGVRSVLAATEKDNVLLQDGLPWGHHPVEVAPDISRLSLADPRRRGGRQRLLRWVRSRGSS